MYRRNIYVVFAFLLGSLCTFAARTDPNDSTLSAKTKLLVTEISSSSGIRSFEQLHIPISENNADPIAIPQQIFSDSTEQFRTKAFQYQNEVLRRNAFIGSLNQLSLLDLPVGLSREGSDINYSIIISQVRVTPAASFVEAYFIFELPQTGDKIAFRGTKIKFSYDGGLSGDGRLELIGNYPIKMNEKTLLTIIGKGNTYVEFNCDGFKQMGVEAEVEFSRDLIVPENEKGEIVASPARVKTQFAVQAQHWNDILLGINLPAFQINGLKGFGFTVKEAYIDWSDIANPNGLIFPEGYSSTYVQGGQPSLWQGFFMKELEVRLPSSFTKRNNTNRVAFGVENMLIDDLGFTGTLFAENVISSGDMSGWAYTLDRVGIDVVTNQIKGFELAGKISVPVIKTKDGKTSQFGYRAQRGADGNYLFSVEIKHEVKLPVFVADVKLLSGSTIIVKEKNGKFYPSAKLNGELTIKALGKGAKASINGIRFENMVISSESPKFEPGIFSFGKEGQENSSASGFPLEINHITFKSQDGRAGIAFDVIVNIGGKSKDEGFGGTGVLTVWGKRESVSIKDAEGTVTGTREEDWTFDKVEISGVGVKIKKPGMIELDGVINFFDADPTYGDGFKGTLTGTIKSITVKAEALFGKTEEFRYWYADALVSLPNGIPMVPGVMSAYGFGGGFYSRMKQSTEPVASTLGRTESGITYVPDENSMGIRAIVLIGAVRKEAWSGDVALEVAMNRHGGINSVTFTGNANFMCAMAVASDKIKELASSAVGGKLTEKLAGLVRGQVYGSVKLHFDNVNDVFHGNLEIFVNVAGGLVRGVSNGNKAGWAVLHFEKNDWYVHIGTPDQPIGLEVARIFKAKSYFMLGKNLPGSPPPPSQVTEILGDVDLDYMRDMNALESGMGFAFGLHFVMDTGDLKFLMFYARFAAGTGLDFMLKDYGENCKCAGQSGPPGIRGWYANGQAYAFVMGKIGIKVKLRYIRGKFDILNIGAAAILQTKGPNPFWMHGIVGGYYRILGGLVKGHCKFEMTIGKDCKIVPATNVEEINPLEDVTIIADMSPSQDTKEIDVFTAPQVAFNVPIGEVFDLTEDPDDQSRRLFRGNLQTFKVLDGSTQIAGNVRWNENNDVVAFDAFDVLPPQKQLKVIVKVVFEEHREGQWRTMYFEGKPIEETKDITFTTGIAPDYIPASNVDISYPAVGQFNFYPKEHYQGFVELKKGQGYLFKAGADWIQKMRVTEALAQAYLETDLRYNDAERRIYFDLPAGLQTSKAYRLEVMNFPKQNQVLDANVKNMERTASALTDMTLRTKSIEGNLEMKEVKTIYTSLFKTSQYNTFKEKASAITLTSTFRETVGTNLFTLDAYLRGSTELFDHAEINERFTDRQVQFEAVVDDNDWYQKKVYPLVYAGYPLKGTINIHHRNVQELGLPPVKSVFIEQPGNYHPVLTEDNLAEPFNAPSIFNSVQYDLMIPMVWDYVDIQRQVANYMVNNPSGMDDRMTTILTTPFPVYTYGKYKVRLKYVIPRINKTTTTHDWELFNTIQD
jgi:hypothetical protein